MKRFLLFFAAVWLSGLGMMNASTCADLNAVTSTSGVNFTLNQVTVVYARAPYIYVQDNTGTSLVWSNWNAFRRLNPGDVVRSITGTAKLYNGLPELMPTDSMISKTSGTAPAIPDATAAPTTADINKVFMYRDVNMGSQSFPSGSAVNKTGTFSGGSVPFRNAWKEAYQFDANKTYDILGCVSIYGSTIQVYAAEITEHHEMGLNPIVVGAKKPAAWGAMYLYAWPDDVEETLLGEWPGTPINVDSTGWAYHTFEGVSAVNYIWNNGSGVQTGDLRTEQSVCQQLVAPQPHISSGHWEAVLSECGSVDPVNPDTTAQQEPITVKLLASSVREVYNCDYVSLYAWQTAPDGSYLGTPLGGWPGTRAQLDSTTGWYQYTFDSNIQDVNIIWSRWCDGGYMQTQDIMHLTSSSCFRLMEDSSGVIAVGANCSLVEPILPVNPDTTHHDTIAPQEPITVRMLASAVADAGWRKLYLYAWNGSAQPLGEWPGTALVADNGWYSYTFADFDTINLVWNDAINTHAQTLNFEGVTASECYALGDSLGYGTPNQYYDCQAIDCNTPVDTTHHDTIPDPVPNVGITIRLAASTVPESWEEVRLLSWTNGVDSAVSTGFGLVLQADSGWYSYTFPAGIDQVDFLFDNGAWGAGNQTVDARAFVSTCYGFGEPDETTDYKFPFLLADCLTGEVFPEVGDTSAHVVYIWDNISRIYWDSIVVPYGADVTLPTDLPQYEGYHFVFWEGLYDGSNVLHNVKTDLYMQAKYYINLPEEPATDPVTVRLKASTVPQSWEHVYIFSWTEGAEVNVWPGVEMQMDDNGWYTHTFPEGIQDIDFLFDNGDGNVGNQTVDVDNVSSNYCFEMAAPVTFEGFYLVYPTECSEIPEPQGMTIRLMQEEWHGGWGNNVNIYAWQHIDSIDVPLLGEWPGAPMQLTDNGWFTYTFQQEYESINLVFSSGTVQTVDITEVSESSCFQVGDGLGWYNGMYVHEAVQVDCSVEPWMYHIVYFYTKDGYLLSSQYVVDGDSAIAPDAPLVPGFEFVGWDKDFSHVTDNMSIYPIYRSSTPIDGYTVRMLPTNGYGWEDIYLYAWATDSLGHLVSQPLGSWPGTKIEKDSTGWHSYTFEYDPVINIVWNDGISGKGLIHQTQDIMGVSESTCYRLYCRDSIGRTIAEVVDCTVNPNTYHTVAFVDMDFDNQLLQVAQVAHGEVLPISPVIPQHEGYKFNYWIDIATMTEFISTEPIMRDMLIDEAYERMSYMVYMVNWDGAIIASGNIYHGNSVNNVDDFTATREGYEFIGWSDDLQNITSVRISVAQFRPITYGNYSIVYIGKDMEMLEIQNVDLNLPVPPIYDGFTFIGWQVLGTDLNNAITIQAVY